MKRRRAPVSTQAIERDVQQAYSFADCRAGLASTIEGLAFVRVVCTQNTAAGYTGEAIEIVFRESREKPKLIFFDKFGRNRNQLAIGPIHLVQAPMGLDHASAMPTVGEILVGSLVPNTRKSHLEFVLRGWSSDAKPLQELLRLLKFGTRYHELEVRASLVQSACLLLQCPDSLRKSRDDIYMTARVILWGNLRPLQILASLQNEDYQLKKPASNEEIEMAKAIKISVSSIEFIDALMVKWPDVMLSEKFLEGLEHRPKPAWTPSAQAIEPAWKSEFKPFKSDFVPRSKTPDYYDINKLLPATSASMVPVAMAPMASGPYMPQSPPYRPNSPPYRPQNPPANMPQSPEYPQSPIYETGTPTFTQTVANIKKVPESPVFE